MVVGLPVPPPLSRPPSRTEEAEERRGAAPPLQAGQALLALRPCAPERGICMRLQALAFVLIAGPALLWNALLVPPGEVPDEIAHIVRADGLLHGSLVGKRRVLPGYPVPVSGVTADRQLVAAWSGPEGPVEGRKLTAERLRIHRLTPWGVPTFVVSPNTAAYAPLAYLPTAAALGIARQAGLGPYDAILAARLASTALYLALGLAALLVARRGRTLLALALLLPTALSLGGSCSQDGILLGIAALCAACLTWPSSPRAFWAAAGLMAVLVLAKPPFLPLAGLVALHAGSWRRGVGAVALAALPSLAWTMYAQAKAGVALRHLGAAVGPGPLWSGAPDATFEATDPAAQLGVVLHAPWSVARRLVPAAWAEAGPWLRQMVGLLGRADLHLPGWYSALALAGLAAALALDLAAPETASTPGAAGTPARTHRHLWRAVAGAACGVAAVGAIHAAEYLTWTPVGAAAVDGMQGRYLLPILLMAPALLPEPGRAAGPAWARHALQRALPGFAAAAALAGAALVPYVTVATYYLR